MAVGRELPSATLLADGRVLVIGGYGGPMSGEGSYLGGTDALASAEVWDPETGVFEPAGTLIAAREGHTATLLPDGRVLIVGGADAMGTSAEIWDPATMTSSATGSPRWAALGGQATLADGRVLVVGGETEDGEVSPPEVWDPATGTFGPGTPSPRRATRRARCSMTGGCSSSWTSRGCQATRASSAGPRTAMVWDPATGSYSPAGRLSVPHGGRFTATRLADGRVLVTGGDGCLLCVPRPSLTRRSGPDLDVLQHDPASDVRAMATRRRSCATGGCSSRPMGSAAARTPPRSSSRADDGPEAPTRAAPR